MRSRHLGVLALVVSLTGPAIGIAAEDDLIALWTTPEGTLEIKDGGTFAGKPNDMDGFAASGRSTAMGCWCSPATTARPQNASTP
jgi:hypothetical protein